ncbi:MAG: hypothetical protein KA154_02450 [Gemmatimonadaceae bacterium]|jgi:hypothetical protein|nr:hypothetical protein [Gemmatimonadaceae bacterium]MCC6430089.1 hypothetical protein [Gemmatimonadaceae bacterium]
MTSQQRRRAVAAALTAAGALIGTRVQAQVTEIARSPIADMAQLTFGYRCDDRFVIRNDGVKPVDLEYAVSKGTEHTKITLNARELVELESKSKEPLELWMDGKLVAKAMKEKRACKDVQGNATVAIAPLEVETNERDTRQTTAFGMYPYYDPFFYGFYGSMGYRPFYRGFVGVPIIITTRGPARRGR